jgi:hypothetical protein
MDHNITPDIDPNSSNVKIGLFHGPIVGLTTDVGYKFEEGFDTHRFMGCDIVLCGDIHKRQTIYLDEEIEVEEKNVEEYLKKGWVIH